MTSTVGRNKPQNGTSRASGVVATQLKAIRRRRNLTAQQLADRCAELGTPGMTPHIIANIETGRRDVSVDELLLFALALDVAPTHLLSPPAENPTALAVTPTVAITDPGLLRRWLRGEAALPESRSRLFYGYALEHMPMTTATEDDTLADYARTLVQDNAAQLVTQFEIEAAALLAGVRDQVRTVLTELEDAVHRGTASSELLHTLERYKDRLPDGTPTETTGAD